MRQIISISSVHFHFVFVFTFYLYNCIRFPLLACLRKEKIDTDRSSFLDNGSILLEDLIASCDGKSNPIHNYYADELIRATNNFDPSGIMQQYSSYKMFQGFLDNRSVIIKKYFTVNWLAEEDTRSMAIRDIVISTQMSSHKNVLKLLGCCLEFPIPALVHEYAAKGVLNFEGGYGDNESLPWKARLRIAKQFANAIAYLRTAFPRPIILRDLKPNCIFLDNDYVSKLCNFAISITIPPLQSHVVDVVIGGYLDPTYLANNNISLKTDVYSFGILLLVFLTGRQALQRNRAGEYEYLIPYVKSHACSGQIQTIMDPKISVEVGGADHAHQQFHDFLALALLCTRDESEARPDMIDVAKELVRIEKFGCTSN